MSADYYEDLANEMGNSDRYIQPGEEEDMPSEKELRAMLKQRVYYNLPRKQLTTIYQGPRRTPVTEDWLVQRDQIKNIRRAATWSRRKHQLNHFLTVGWTFLLAIAVAIGIWAAIVWFVRQVLP